MLEKMYVIYFWSSFFKPQPHSASVSYLYINHNVVTTTLVKRFVTLVQRFLAYKGGSEWRSTL